MLLLSIVDFSSRYIECIEKLHDFWFLVLHAKKKVTLYSTIMLIEQPLASLVPYLQAICFRIFRESNSGLNPGFIQWLP